MDFIRLSIVLARAKRSHYKHRLERFNRPLYSFNEILVLLVPSFSVLAYLVANS
jgi:hypothetical protein